MERKCRLNLAAFRPVPLNFKLQIDELEFEFAVGAADSGRVILWEPRPILREPPLKLLGHAQYFGNHSYYFGDHS
jgi:hypothetical protein